MKAAVSLLVLAWHVFVHFLLLPFRCWRRDKQRFRDAYRADRLLSLSARESGELVGFERCIGCGLCNTLCPTLATAPRYVFGGPASLAARARSFPDFQNFAGYFLHESECSGCHACESICPTGVPLRALSAHVREHAAALAGKAIG